MTDTSIITALSKALPELEGAKKNANNPQFKGKYANLTAVIEAVRPITAHGLWYRQVSHDKPDGACIETIYIHESGQELSAGLVFVKADKSTAQGFGSAITYARRYSLQAAFGLDAEDDDGNAASSTPPPPKVEAITEAQITQIIDYLEAHDIPVGQLLNVARIDKVSNMDADRFDGAMGWIKDQIKAKKET